MMEINQLPLHLKPSMCQDFEGAKYTLSMTVHFCSNTSTMYSNKVLILNNLDGITPTVHEIT